MSSPDLTDELDMVREHINHEHGDVEPLTTLETELTGAGAIATFLTEVIEVELLQPNLRRIRFSGGLERFESIGGDQFMFVLLPPMGSDVLTVGTDFTWEKNNKLAQDQQATGAYYSIRSFEPDPDGQGAESIDMWFVLHDHGRATEWAANARPGNQVALWGPRRTFEPPPGTDSYLLVTDESGFGATVALLDELSLDLRHPPITVIAETSRPGLAIDLPLPLNATVEWVFRHGTAAVEGSLMLDAVQTITVGENTYAYGAGESHHLSAVRRYLRQDLGLRSEQVSMTAYWRATPP